MRTQRETAKRNNKRIQRKEQQDSFFLPMLVNLAFIFLMWGAALIPDELSGMTDEIYSTKGELRFGLALMFPIIVKKASLITWAFFGGYIYIITAMIRRWMRSDLTTNFLWQLNVRLAIIFFWGCCS